ncbi:MAG: thioredoxin-like domain-containing protein [Gemmataceae bacterium]
MSKAKKAMGFMAGCLLGLGGMQAHAAPTVAQMLTFRPKIDGIEFSTPAAEEHKNCKVELINGAKPGSNGWLLRDAQGRPVRRYFDSNGDKKVNVWSYYNDGLEVYREIDSNHNEKIDQYRWMNTAGTRWGVDFDEDGKIDSWKVISAEEVSREALDTLIKRDFARFQALLITDAEMSALELPAAEVQRVKQLRGAASNKFMRSATKLNLSPKAEWVRLEAGLPQLVPGDQVGSSHDLIKYGRAAILFEDAGKHDFIQLGEMIQVGVAWRLIDVPGDDESPSVNPELQKLLDELRQLDARAPQTQEGSNSSDVIRYNLQRANLIERVLPVDKPERRELWLRQLAESLHAAAQVSMPADRTAFDRLVNLRQQLEREQPGKALTAFVAFRELQAEYARKLVEIQNDKDQAKYPLLQAEWLEKLARYVAAYPTADEAGDALNQLGMVSEFVNKEIEARNWYARLVKDFPNHPAADSAAGAIRRLECEGKEIELKDGNFDIATQRGKMVVVYFWASWNHQYVGDFARLKLLQSTYAGKGFEVVAINLDNGPPEAGNRVAVPGIQVLQPEGLEGPLATHYGIKSLPTLFLVGKDGKVISRTIQVGNLEDELKKHLK